jgi:hypothetical protein
MGNVRLRIFKRMKYAMLFFPIFLRLPFGRNRPIMKSVTTAMILKKRKMMNPLTRVENIPKNTEVINRNTKFVKADLSE